MDDDFIERFQRYYIAQEKTACWNWTGTVGTNGRGQIKYKRKTCTASRLAYEIHYKVKPGEMYVLHTCDNGLCVNPHHLFLGTQKDNVHDMYNKGRQVHPPRPRKLTETDVAHIKWLIFTGVKNTMIAAQYGCTHKNISKIKCGDAWKKVKMEGQDKLPNAHLVRGGTFIV